MLISATRATTLGVVLHGSDVLGVLFLIFVNDFYISGDELNFQLFADDVNLLHADKSLKIIEISY